jgi:hypothetical protein
MAIPTQAESSRQATYPSPDDDDLERSRMIVYERASRPNLVGSMSVTPNVGWPVEAVGQILQFFHSPSGRVQGPKEQVSSKKRKV